MSNKNKIHEYFDTTYSQWNICDFLNECDLEPFGQKIACYIRSLGIIVSCETDHRRERAKELLDKYKELRPSHEASVGAYTTYESSYVQGFDRSDTGPAGAYMSYETSYGTRPDRCLARNWDNKRKSVERLNEPSINAHNPTFIGGTVSGIIYSETFTAGPLEKDQKKARGCIFISKVDNINALFKYSSSVKSTKFLEKLRRLSDNSEIISDDNDEEDKTTIYSLCNTSDTDESTFEESASDTSDNGVGQFAFFAKIP
ncbi:7111_t:CDS:2 [Acaulospora morrowiae]|uniref:7111_t:CDS:1 n=1 Tax=Acaulospora morrowiae TaxID=94023 RepID=A0A9N9G3L6_9GLOM|nr:7111_t:CDS:2 [Acaulospora morrowiae]